MTGKRTQFEQNNKYDFERLDHAQCLEALRVFATTHWLMMITISCLTEGITDGGVYLQNRLALAKTRKAQRTACENHYKMVTELVTSLTPAFEMHAELLGSALAIVGVQPITDAPSTSTKQ